MMGLFDGGDVVPRSEQESTLTELFGVVRCFNGTDKEAFKVLVSVAHAIIEVPDKLGSR